MLHEGVVSGTEEHSLSPHHPQRHQTEQLSLQQSYPTVRDGGEGEREREREREKERERKREREREREREN